MSPPLRLLTLALFSLSLATSCNVVRLTTRKLERTFARSDMQRATMRSGRFVVDYRDGGETSERTPVLLIHGFGASAIWQWSEQVKELSESRRVLVPDLLWFGESSSVQSNFSVDEQVEAMRAFLEHLGVHEVDVVGISYGGMVAHELALAETKLVRKLVLVDSPGRNFTRADYKAMCARFGAGSAQDFLLPTDTDGVQVLLDLAYHSPPHPPRWAKQQILDGLYRHRRDEQAALLQNLVDHLEDFSARPDPEPRPTLVVWGEGDEVFPLASGEALAERLGARLEVMRRARHAPPIEHPKAFNPILLEFLDEDYASRAR